MSKMFKNLSKRTAAAAFFVVLLAFLLTGAWNAGRNRNPGALRELVSQAAAPRHAPAPIDAAAPEAPPPSPAVRDSLRAEKAVAEQLPPSPARNTLLGQLTEEWQAQREWDEARQAILDQVNNETIEESVDRLFTEPFSRLFSPRSLDLFEVPSRYARYAESDPRVAKLIQIARSGTEAERQTLYTKVLEGMDRCLHDFALRDVTRPDSLPSDVNSAAALPIILAEFGASREHIGLVVDVWDALQEMERESLEESYRVLGEKGISLERDLTSSYAMSPLSGMLTWSAWRMLDEALGSARPDGPVDPGLSEYGEFREALHAQAVLMIADGVTYSYLPLPDEPFAPENVEFLVQVVGPGMRLPSYTETGSISGFEYTIRDFARRVSR